MKPFAVFDIDGTLIRWQLFHAIVHSLGKSGHIPADAHERIAIARADWKHRTTNGGFAVYEDVLVREYLAAIRGIPPRDYELVVNDVFEKYKDQTFTYTRNLLHSLKAQGYFLLAISGSHHEIITKIATYHGFDDTIGAKLEIRDGRFTGNIQSPIFQKDQTLKELVAKHTLNFKDSYAIGDSTSDAQMLALVSHPIAFNPDQALFSIADEQGWDIVVERKNMVFELHKLDGRYQLMR